MTHHRSLHHKPLILATTFLITLLLAFSLRQGLRAAPPNPFIYTSPRPGAAMVSRETTIAVRAVETLDASCLRALRFEVRGNVSGDHAGQTVLADDNRTVIFKPDQPFALGERVNVTIDPASQHVTCGSLRPWTYDFTIEQIRPVASWSEPALPAVPVGAQTTRPARSLATSGTITSPHLVTVPDNYPDITVTLATGDTGEGYIFLSNFYFFNRGFRDSEPYLLILDNRGEPVFYRRMPDGWPILDFKKQPNGSLTYWNSQTRSFFALNERYEIIDEYQAGNGYICDLHDLQILPNGHVLLMIYDNRTVDMSAIVPGGLDHATVAGLIIQELDQQDNVVFEWRSWDHMNITDTLVSLTAPQIDYVHGNAVELDDDGNILVSSRHLSEITKIDRQTGEIIWRWGGKRNEFTLIGDAQGFDFQHDIRRLPNGHVTLFDNRNNLEPKYSRAVEYILDEEAKTATLYREYRNTPDIYAGAMGNAQRLDNGNTVIGWGYANQTVTEVMSDGTKVFELILPSPQSQYYSYRAFRFPWTGNPTWPPYAVLTTDGVTKTLHYSWNGATEVDYYEIHAGNSPISTTVVMTQSKQGFETQTVLTPAMLDYCYLQVMPIDKTGNSTTFSNKVLNPQPGCNFLFMPIIWR